MPDKKIEITIKVLIVKNKPEISINCDGNSKIKDVMDTIAVTHAKMVTDIDLYFKKHPVLSKSEMSDIYNKLQVKDLKL